MTCAKVLGSTASPQALGGIFVQGVDEGGGGCWWRFKHSRVIRFPIISMQANLWCEKNLGLKMICNDYLGNFSITPHFQVQLLQKAESCREREIYSKERCSEASLWLWILKLASRDYQKQYQRLSEENNDRALVIVNPLYEWNRILRRRRRRSTSGQQLCWEGGWGGGGVKRRRWRRRRRMRVKIWGGDWRGGGEGLRMSWSAGGRSPMGGRSARSDQLSSHSHPFSPIMILTYWYFHRDLLSST